MCKSEKIAIINYGAGNLGSVINAVEHLDHKPVVLNKPKNNEFFSPYYTSRCWKFWPAFKKLGRHRL